MAKFCVLSNPLKIGYEWYTHISSISAFNFHSYYTVYVMVRRVNEVNMSTFLELCFIQMSWLCSFLNCLVYGIDAYDSNFILSYCTLSILMKPSSDIITSKYWGNFVKYFKLTCSLFSYSYNHLVLWPFCQSIHAFSVMIYHRSIMNLIKKKDIVNVL